MRMNKLYKAMFALAATGTLLPVAPALAAAPDPGPGWVLTSQKTVRNWVPEAGAGWVLVGQRPVTEFVPDPVSSPLPAGANGAGHWEMLSFRDRNYFVADSAITRKLVASNTAEQYVGAGTQRFDAERQVVSKTPREVRTDLKNPSKETLNNGIYEVFKLVKIDTWNDVQYQSPVFNMKQKQLQVSNFFQFQWSDGIYGTLMSEADPKVDVGPWTNSGATERNGLARYDLWDQLVKENPGTLTKDIMLARVPLSLASNEAAKAKSATFLSDSGSGGSATSVAGSQKRTAFKADEAVVSNVKEPTSAGTGAGDLNLPGSGNVISLPKATPAPAIPEPTPAPIRVVVPTPAPVVVATPAPVVDNKGFSMEDWIGTWKSKGQTGNPYDYQVVVQKHSSKNVQYSFDSWFKADAFDNLPPTDFSKNGAFADDKKTAYYDNEGTVNCNLKLSRDNGQLRMTGTVTLREMDWWGKVLKSKTYNVNLTK